MYRLIPRSELHVYHGGHLDLATDAERMARVVEAFLAAGTGDRTTATHGTPRRLRRWRGRAGGLRVRTLRGSADRAPGCRVTGGVLPARAHAGRAGGTDHRADRRSRYRDYPMTRSANRSMSEAGAPAAAGYCADVAGALS